MVIQFVSGGGAINAITRENNQTLKVIDMGVDHDFSLATGVIDAKVRRGTRNFSTEPTMTLEECQLAIERGQNVLSESTPSIIGVGEMGIGNSTSACAIACAILNLSVSEVVGGLELALVQRRSLGKPHSSKRRSTCIKNTHISLQVLQRLGGFEIAGLVGLI